MKRKKMFFSSEVNRSGYNLDIDPLKFALATAHQKEDLIDRRKDCY